MRVKICGNRSAADVEVAVAGGADALGFIVGVRYRSEDAITPEAAARLVALVPVYVTPVLVTHLNTAAEVLAVHEAVGAAAIQFADRLPDAELAAIRKALPRVALIQAVHVTGLQALDEAERLEPLFEALLLDSRTGDRVGGTGQVHDWRISRQIVAAARKPVILAGGLRPENIAAAIAAVRPYGVDVNSGVDSEDGSKDTAKVRAFVTGASAAGLNST
jgi:phosphoribosylanthranilate isomerase